MAGSASLARLATWGLANGVQINVNDGTHATTGNPYWTVGVSITSPVKFSATSSFAPTLEEAAAQVIKKLENVGVVIP